MLIEAQPHSYTAFMHNPAVLGTMFYRSSIRLPIIAKEV